MTTKQIIQAVGGIFSALFIAGICYGSYQFYFNKKPTTIINNVYKNYTMSGDNATVVEAPKTKPVDRRLFTGIYGNRNEVGGMVGYLW